MGVKRAIGMARKAASDEGHTVFTYGPLIHNPQELERLREDNIVPFGEEEEAPKAPVIIRAHGVTPQTLERLTRDAEKVLDATCPKVSSIQKRIREYSANGYSIVIAGEKDHPEVVGLLGYASGKAFVIGSPEDIDALPEMDKVLLVSQTTQDEQKYEKICERFSERFPGGESLATICSSTHMRQSEIRKMVREVDAMIVIGGRNSGNTRRLQAISAEAGLPSYHIERAAELPIDRLSGLKVVGVSAGASTPDWIIKEVVEALEKI
jgi:4-hydroxy-3-methylbut-2-enyl diphosphate reductase